MKNLLSAVALTIGVGLSAPASAIVVGGIDFGVLGDNPLNTHIETATLAETFVNGVGQTLSGYGQITTVNGATNYCAVGTCSLYYYFTDYEVTYFDGSNVQFSGGRIDIYYTDAPINLLNQSSAANIAAITSMTEWARLIGHEFVDGVFAALKASDPVNFGGLFDTQTLSARGTLLGETLAIDGFGLLDVDLSGAFGLATVAAYLNANSIADGLGGFADIQIGAESSNEILNPFDILSGAAAGCGTGQAAPGAWCLAGSASIRGSTVVQVPEPGSLALLSLGLLAIGAVTRRKSFRG